jgi:glutathione S-transferase
MRRYHMPGSRSTRVLWMLEELGVPYELTLMTREERYANLGEPGTVQIPC